MVVPTPSELPWRLGADGLGGLAWESQGGYLGVTTQKLIKEKIWDF